MGGFYAIFAYNSNKKKTSYLWDMLFVKSIFDFMAEFILGTQIYAQN